MQLFEKQYQVLVTIINRLEELDSITKPDGRDIETEWRALAIELKDASYEIQLLTEPYTPESFTKAINKAQHYLESIRSSWGICTKESINCIFGPVDDDMNWHS